MSWKAVPAYTPKKSKKPIADNITSEKKEAKKETKEKAKDRWVGSSEKKESKEKAKDRCMICFDPMEFSHVKVQEGCNHCGRGLCASCRTAHPDVANRLELSRLKFPDEMRWICQHCQTQVISFPCGHSYFRDEKQTPHPRKCVCGTRFCDICEPVVTCVGCKTRIRLQCKDCDKASPVTSDGEKSESEPDRVFEAEMADRPWICSSQKHGYCGCSERNKNTARDLVCSECKECRRCRNDSDRKVRYVRAAREETHLPDRPCDACWIAARSICNGCGGSTRKTKRENKTDQKNKIKDGKDGKTENVTNDKDDSEWVDFLICRGCKMAFCHNCFLLGHICHQCFESKEYERCHCGGLHQNKTEDQMNDECGPIRDLCNNGCEHHERQGEQHEGYSRERPNKQICGRCGRDHMWESRRDDAGAFPQMSDLHLCALCPNSVGCEPCTGEKKPPPSLCQGCRLRIGSAMQSMQIPSCLQGLLIGTLFPPLPPLLCRQFMILVTIARDQLWVPFSAILSLNPRHPSHTVDTYEVYVTAKIPNHWCRKITLDLGVNATYSEIRSSNDSSCIVSYSEIPEASGQDIPSPFDLVREKSSKISVITAVKGRVPSTRFKWQMVDLSFVLTLDHLLGDAPMKKHAVLTETEDIEELAQADDFE